MSSYTSKYNMKKVDSSDLVDVMEIVNQHADTVEEKLGEVENSIPTSVLTLDSLDDTGTSTRTDKAATANSVKKTNDLITDANGNVEAVKKKLETTIATSTSATTAAGITSIDSTDANILEFDFGCVSASNYAAKYIEINTLTGAYNMSAVIGGAMYAKVTLVRNGNSTWTAFMTMSGKTTGGANSTQYATVNINSSEITSVRLHAGATGDTYSNWRCVLRKIY